MLCVRCPVWFSRGALLGPLAILVVVGVLLRPGAALAAGYIVTTLVPAGLNGAGGVAVDGSGNVYIADSQSNAIKEWVKSSGTVTTLVASGLNYPQGVAVDASGNVYIADSNTNNILEASPPVTSLTQVFVPFVVNAASLPGGGW